MRFFLMVVYEEYTTGERDRSMSFKQGNFQGLNTLLKHSYPFISHFGVIETILTEKVVAKLPFSSCHF